MEYSKKVPHGIMFHHFHNDKHPKTQGSISAEDFKKILNYIGVERILSPAEWLERLVENKLKPEDICLTFDDGLLSQFEVALPVLELFKLKAFWFVYSGVFEGKLENLEIYRLFRTKYFENIDDFYQLFFRKVLELDLAGAANPELEEKAIEELQTHFPFYSVNDARFRFIRDRVLGKENYERLMDSILAEYGVNKSDLAKNLWTSDQDLKLLNDNGHLIGLHSYSHPTALADLSYQEQFEEYHKNYLHLKRACGKNPIAMSHPANSYNEDTLKILREFGIYCGFLSNMVSKPLAGNRLAANNLEISREDHANLIRVL